MNLFFLRNSVLEFLLLFYGNRHNWLTNLGFNFCFKPSQRKPTHQQQIQKNPQSQVQNTRPRTRTKQPQPQSHSHKNLITNHKTDSTTSTTTLTTPITLRSSTTPAQNIQRITTTVLRTTIHPATCSWASQPKSWTDHRRQKIQTRWSWTRTRQRQQCRLVETRLRPLCHLSVWHL